MLKRYRSSVFMKGFMSLFAGSAIAQLIPLALAPFISRTFSVDDVAVYGLYLSIVSTFSVVIGGRYEMAVVLPKENLDSIRIVHVTILISFLTSAAAGLVFLIFGDLIESQLKNENISDWYWLITSSFFLIGVYQGLNMWLIRNRMFVASSINKVGQRISEGALVIYSGNFGLNGGLILGDVVGRLTMTLISLYQSIKLDFHKVRFSLSHSIILIKEFKQFPLGYGFSSLANSAAAHVPILFISAAYQSLAVGYFNMMKYVLSAPVAFISRNVAQVFLERLANKWRNSKPVSNDFLKLTALMSVIACLFVFPILFFGQEIFIVAFGEEWTEAGKYAQIMVVSFGLRFVVSPLSSLLNAINKVRNASFWQWFYFTSILTLIPVSKMNFSILEFLFYYTVVEGSMYVIYWVIIFTQAVKHDKKLTDFK